MKLPKGFVLKGQIYGSGALPPTGLRMLEFLSKMKNGELITSRELVGAIDTTVNTVRQIGAHELLKPYRYLLRSKSLVWGNKWTIRELGKRMNARV